MRWYDDAEADKANSNFIFFKFSQFSEITIQEQFTFCMCTELSDMAAHFPYVRDGIVRAQIDLLEKLTQKIAKHVGEEFNLNSHLTKNEEFDNKGFYFNAYD